MTTDAFNHGAVNCIQDDCENCPFGSIGGLSKRESPEIPSYVKDEVRDEWLRGYLHTAQTMYGENWRTVPFGWSPALTIGGDK